MINNQLRILELCEELIETKVPECKYAILTGSSVNPHTMTDTSDIDLLIFLDDIFLTHADLIVFQEIPFDLISIPFYNIPQILNDDIVNKKGKFLDMIAKGIIVRDQNNVLKELKELCILKFKLGAPATSLYDINRIYVMIVGRLKDLKSESNFEICIFLMNEILQYTVGLIITYNSFWGGWARWNYNYINEIEPDFMKSLMNSYRSSIINEDTTSFIEAIDMRISSFASILNSVEIGFWNKNDLDSKPFRIFAINIDSSNYFELLNNLVIPISKSIGCLLYKNEDYSINTNYILQFENSDSSRTKQLILDYKDRFALFNIYELENVSHPLENFSNRDLVDAVNLFNQSYIPLFLKVYSEQEHWYLNNSLILSLNFHLTICKVIGFSLTDIYRLNKYLIEKWVNNIDIPLALSYESLKTKRHTYLEKTQSEFNEARAFLLDNYAELLENWESIDLADDTSTLLLELTEKISDIIESKEIFCAIKGYEAFHGLSDQEKIKNIIYGEFLKYIYNIHGVHSDSFLNIPFFINALIDATNKK